MFVTRGRTRYTVMRSSLSADELDGVRKPILIVVAVLGVLAALANVGFGLAGALHQLHAIARAGTGDTQLGTGGIRPGTGDVRPATSFGAAAPGPDAGASAEVRTT